MTRWIGPDETLTVGQVGFLVEFSNAIRRSERYELRDRPPYTNQSHEPTLVGWCGSYNDLSTTGHGMARVVRLARNGRALVEELAGADLTAALEELGYPELDPSTD